MSRGSAYWDRYFLNVAAQVALASRDPSTQTGAVIVRPDKTVASVGYNGFPRGMADRAEWYADRAEKYSRIIHCEMNAALHCREPVAGATLYTWPFASCDRCVVHMLQFGITRFVFPVCPPDKVARWGAALERTLQYITECGATYTIVEEGT